MRNGWGDDDRIVPEPVRLWEADVVLYRADGTPLKRQIGFAMQTSQTFPENSKGGKKKTSKGGRKGC